MIGNDMNTTTEILNAIGTFGFPVVACCGLFWMINTTMKELTGALDKLSDTIAELKHERKDS